MVSPGIESALEHQPLIDDDRALQLLLRFLSVEGISGQEKLIADELVKILLSAGVPSECIRFDDAHNKIPLPAQIGNLIVTLPGNVSGVRRLFCAHLDTVPLALGCKPVIRGSRIESAVTTALGGDNRTGVACLASIIATIIEQKPAHPALTFLFTVHEESGGWGARTLDPKDLGSPVEGYNVDGGSPADITIGAVGKESWEVEIIGKAAHAGVHPEQGVSALLVASLALTKIHQEGWFGEINRGNYAGASNVVLSDTSSGSNLPKNTNVVADYVVLKGESRSQHLSFIYEITAAYKGAFQEAALQVRNSDQDQAEIKFRSELSYRPFTLNSDSACIQRAIAAASSQAMGSPQTLISKGGLDANWLVQHGIPTITFGAGEHRIHTVDEYIEVPEFLAACRMGLAIAV